MGNPLIFTQNARCDSPLNYSLDLKNSRLSPGPNEGHCAELPINMKFGTNVHQNILNSLFEGTEAGAHWDHHICQIQDGC